MRNEILLAVVARCMFLFISFYLVSSSPGWELPYDVSLYQTYAHRILDGLMPYRDFFVEYPPVFLSVVLLPGSISKLFGTMDMFWLIFAGFMICCEAGIVWLLGTLDREIRKKQTPEKGLFSPSFLYAVSPACIGFSICRFDPFSSFFLLASVYLLYSKKPVRAGLSAGVGAAAKWYPTLLPVIFCCSMFHISGKRNSWWNRFPATAAGVMIVAFLPFFVISPGGMVETHLFHLSRSPNAQSLHKFISEAMGILGVGMSPDSLSFSLGLLLILSLVLVCLGLIVQVPRVGRDPGRNIPSLSTVAERVVIVLGLFLCLNKTFSPQYFLWIAPFMLLVFRSTWSIVLYFLLQAALLAEFPLFYSYFPNRMMLGLAAGARWGLLALFTFLAVKRQFFDDGGRGEQGEPR